MSNCYCKYCGTCAPNIRTLTTGSCHRHPDGSGRHALYEGDEKSRYECKYCGTNAPNIRSLTLGSCHRHPDGKGRHSPAL